MITTALGLFWVVGVRVALESPWWSVAVVPAGVGVSLLVFGIVREAVFDRPH